MANFTRDYELSDKQKTANTYTLSGTLCTPKSGANSPDHVQLLVHGVGFDSRSGHQRDKPRESICINFYFDSYWDFSASEEYSYVRAASEAGFTTFRYDRLGTGLSEKPQDAYK